MTEDEKRIRIVALKSTISLRQKLIVPLQKELDELEKPKTIETNINKEVAK